MAELAGPPVMRLDDPALPLTVGLLAFKGRSQLFEDAIAASRAAGLRFRPPALAAHRAVDGATREGETVIGGSSVRRKSDESLVQASGAM